jgi:formylglycine-generating enzyme required for sulfatase activity
MVVDDFDFNLVITNFGGSGPAGDSNGDGIVDDFDFNAVITNFGTDARNNYTGVMINIPAGDFQMGNNGNEGYSNSDELPQHWVTLSSYRIGKYEVTRGDYKKFMNAGGYSNPAYSVYWSTDGWSWKGSKTEPLFWTESQYWGSPPGWFDQSDNHPVVGVSYYEAEAFCNWAGGHLPTEAQWEKAARWTGSHPNVYPWGDSGDYQMCNSWYDSVCTGNQTAPVGSYETGASPYGCQDMAGNVWEWCKDWYGSSYYSSSPTSDPPGPSSGSWRVLRGGSWNENNYAYIRCAFRNRYTPTQRYSLVGFRCAMTP